MKLPKFKTFIKDECDTCATVALVVVRLCGVGVPWLVCAMPLTIGALIRLFVTLEKI